MFSGTVFDRDISEWDVSHVEDMSCMFRGDYYNKIKTQFN